jgi:NAD(P)H-nitrite reductase large subunit
MHHVILGAGPAGVIAAETLRKQAPEDRITLVGAEPEAPYSRMAIPYLLMGNIGEEGTLLRKGARHYGDLRIEQVQATATGVDVKARTVRLDNGATLAFDTLLIATGSTPASPPIPGITLPGVETCWTLADARAIMNRTAEPNPRVLQMGAGFIGCIILEALAARGVQLTVVEMGDRMVPRMMGPAAGGMIKRWVEGKGVAVHTGTRVEAIAQGQGDTLDVKLSSGKTLNVDLVISATGVKPAIGFLKDSGVKCLLGVLTDEHLQTNVPGIYAAGDCAEAYDKISGQAIVSAIQPNAAEQARIAATNMARQGQPGKRAVLHGVTQINVLDTLGLISASFGNWQGVNGGQHVELTDAANWRHLSLQFQDDVLVGCNSVGWTEHVGVMRGLVEDQVKLGRWKDELLRDPTQLVPAYLASAQAQGLWNGAGDGRRR